VQSNKPNATARGCELSVCSWPVRQVSPNPRLCPPCSRLLYPLTDCYAWLPYQRSIYSAPMHLFFSAPELKQRLSRHFRAAPVSVEQHAHCNEFSPNHPRCLSRFDVGDALLGECGETFFPANETYAVTVSFHECLPPNTASTSPTHPHPASPSCTALRPSSSSPRHFRPRHADILLADRGELWLLKPSTPQTHSTSTASPPPPPPNHRVQCRRAMMSAHERGSPTQPRAGSRPRSSRSR
jgi:hypothetical protein